MAVCTKVTRGIARFICVSALSIACVHDGTPGSELKNLSQEHRQALPIASSRYSTTQSSHVTGSKAKHEVLRVDARWCGPRVLFFFSCYSGLDFSLDEVLELCDTDKNGNTCLFQLVAAARDMGMDPAPVELSFDGLLATRGPAIVCVRAAPIDDGKPWLHFVGMLSDNESGAIWIVDPAQATVALLKEEDDLRAAFTGHAVLLKGSQHPLTRPSWWTWWPRCVVAVLLITLLLRTRRYLKVGQ